jgi:hypothetical protein
VVLDSKSLSLCEKSREVKPVLPGVAEVSIASASRDWGSVVSLALSSDRLFTVVRCKEIWSGRLLGRGACGFREGTAVVTPRFEGGYSQDRRFAIQRSQGKAPEQRNLDRAHGTQAAGFRPCLLAGERALFSQLRSCSSLWRKRVSLYHHQYPWAMRQNQNSTQQ